MLKKKIMILLIVFMSLFIGNLVFAGTCPIIVGDWDFTHVGVSWDGNYEYYEPTNFVISITNQNECLFYGEMGDRHFTGAINGNTVIITAHDLTMSGILDNKTLTFLVSEITGPSDDACATHILTAKRK